MTTTDPTIEVIYRHNNVRVITGEDVCGSIGSETREPVVWFRVESRGPDGWLTEADLEAPKADRPLVAQAATEALRQADTYDAT